MPKVMVNLEANQVKNIVMKLALEDKMEIVKILERELFGDRFKRLLKELGAASQKYPLSLDEITQEVETVRKKRA